MGQEEEWGSPPTSSPFYLETDHMKQFDNSIDAMSFGFLATAILISMFLIMAIFERFIRHNSPDLEQAGGRGRHAHDLESQIGFAGKLCHASPKLTTMEGREISVMMPGENQPTFLAYPVPVPCPPMRITWPPPPLRNYASSSNPNVLSSNINASSSSLTTNHQASENEIVCLQP